MTAGRTPQPSDNIRLRRYLFAPLLMAIAVTGIYATPPDGPGTIRLHERSSAPQVERRDR